LVNFSEDWDEAVYKTYTVQTHVKLLETTRAIEEFCAFSNVNEARGAGSGKLLASGELLIIVPPMEVTHTVSKAAGARNHFQYGWVELTISGHISRAEGMLEPAQGWDFVEKWVRDQAYNMLECEMAVEPEVVFASEALLRAEYASKADFDRARHERSMVAEHFILPRPSKEVAKHSRDHQARAEALDEGFYEMHEEAGSGGGADPCMNIKCTLHACLFVRFCESNKFSFQSLQVLIDIVLLVSNVCASHQIILADAGIALPPAVLPLPRPAPLPLSPLPAGGPALLLQPLAAPAPPRAAPLPTPLPAARAGAAAGRGFSPSIFEAMLGKALGPAAGASPSDSPSSSTGVSWSTFSLSARYIRPISGASLASFVSMRSWLLLTSCPRLLALSTVCSAALVPSPSWRRSFLQSNSLPPFSAEQFSPSPLP
jgi:hypothetical protein